MSLTREGTKSEDDNDGGEKEGAQCRSRSTAQSAPDAVEVRVEDAEVKIPLSPDVPP